MMKSIVINPTDHILIIAPHADDESIGVGGVLSLYGKQCDVWLLTDGSECGGLSGKEKDEIVNIRKREFESAMTLAEVNSFRMFNINDGTLSFHTHTLDCEWDKKYTKVFIPSQDENHNDHVAAFEIGFNMLRSNIIEKSVEVYCYEITRPMKEFNCYLDISNVVPQKDALINCHKSQVANIDYVQMSGALNRFRGIILNKEINSAEVYYKLNIEEFDVNGAGSNLFLKKELVKYKTFSEIFKNSLLLESKGIGVAKSLNKMGIHSIAIYGYGVLGRAFYKYLNDTGLDIKCIIDKSKIENVNVKVINSSEKIPSVDAIVVTSVFDFDEIKKHLLEQEECSNISILNLKNLILEE